MRLALLAALLAGSAGQRLVAQNRSLLLDGVSPHFFRAVLYSPAPWGTDDDLYFKTDYYASHWPALFERDLRLMALMGANAVRLQGSFGITQYLGRHTAFLDAASASGIDVLLSYDLTGRGDGAVSLVSTADQQAVALSFQAYILAAKHPATVMVFLGESINRFEAGFLCNAARDSFGFITSIPCQFGEDVDAFAAALEGLCLIARQSGLSCTVPVANLPLPVATQVAKYGALGERPSRGALDWLDVLAAGMPSMDVISASLVASNTSEALTFELDLAALPTLLPPRPCAPRRLDAAPPRRPPCAVRRAPSPHLRVRAGSWWPTTASTPTTRPSGIASPACSTTRPSRASPPISRRATRRAASTS